MPKRPGISVTKEVYEALRAEARRQGVSVRKVLESILKDRGYG